MKIYPENEPEKAISLAGEWLSALELAVEQPAKSRPSSSELFNGMITPLLPLRIKGVIWYQGESNADRASEYMTLLKTMITDWRKRWNSGDFSFYIVQLANYMQSKNEPAESLWAQLRNSQDIVANELRNCGLATAIDLGEANDIHPQNKKDVGIRLALQALRKTYRLKSVHCDCPRAVSAKQDGNTIVVDFETEGFALKTKDGAEPREFAIGDGSGKYYWASSAKIAGTKVILKLPEEISSPQKVRYAWADNPQVNLYDESGLPALPFELQVK